MTRQEQEVYAYLDTLEISFERHEHPPVVTVEEAERHWAGIDATHCKNLFLRNQKGDRYYLVIVMHSKRVDLRRIAGQIGDGKLSFASSERMMTCLGVTPGSVSPFGLINDRHHHVRVFVDRDLKSAARLLFHPNVNTVTVTISAVDFERYLAARGSVQYIHA
jgi:Ala-tRNA(Pro) deacylase